MNTIKVLSKEFEINLNEVCLLDMKGKKYLE